MDVLLIGGAGYVMDAIIHKLKKEGHRIFVLTGRPYETGKYKHVYEKYHFEYEKDCIKEVFDSINPSVTIFTGAYDSNFNWAQPQKAAVRYAAGLLNTLMAFASLHHGRFIYFSSEQVYETSSAVDIQEDDVTTPQSFRALALAQGEATCLNYRQQMGLDVVILRIAHLQHVPSGAADVQDICGRMCMEALYRKRIVVHPNHSMAILFLSDAIEFIYKVVVASGCQHPIYHISATKEMDERALGELVQEAVGVPIEITEKLLDSHHRSVLSNARFQEVFGMSIRNSEKDIIRQILGQMQKHSSAFAGDTRKTNTRAGKVFGKLQQVVRALIPLVENLVCFVLFFMLNNRAVGSTYFSYVDVYLIYVLLFAIVYGQQQATLSAILAVLGYCFRQMYTRTGFNILIDYNTYVWVGQLFALGLVVGYMRDRLGMIKGEDELEINYLSDQLDSMQDINSNNVRMKNVLETQVVNQNDGIGKIYEVVSALDKYEVEEVLFYAAEVLGQLMDSGDVAIYTVAGGDYARIISATSAKARALGNTIHYTELQELYEDISNQRVFINRKLNPHYPLMANAIYSEDKMQLILMIWGIPWERMTLNQANRLVVVGYLIQNAVVRANRYMEALKNQRYVEGTNILGTDAFRSLLKAYLSAGQKGLAICAVLQVDVPDQNFERAGNVLKKKLRETDYLGTLGDGKLYALLSNTDPSGARFVINRLQEAGYASAMPEEVLL